MKRILLSTVLIVVAFLGGRALYIAMASDETRIGWLFAAEANAFNSARVLSVLSHFAPDYRDDTTGVTVQELRGAMLWTFQNRRDAERRFLYRVELPEGAGAVNIDEDRAKAKLPVCLYETIDGVEQLAWKALVTAELRRIDGDWRVDRSTLETTQGHMPPR
jgi:hypothetical protein